MGVPSSQVAACWVKEGLNSVNWVPLRDVVFLAIKQRWAGKSDGEISDYVETNLPYVAEHLRDTAAEWVIDGAVPTFEIDSEPSPYIRLLSALPSNLVSKLRKIDPFMFEQVCADVLTALGAESQTTRRSYDGGVDFVAVNLKIVPNAFLVPVACKAAVVGQAKRYKDGNPINETRLREFVGAATLKKHELCVAGRIGPLAPVLFAFWTTSDFDSNAKSYARQLGLWYMDGHTMAAYVDNLGLRELVLSLPDASALPTDSEPPSTQLATGAPRSDAESHSETLTTSTG